MRLNNRIVERLEYHGQKTRSGGWRAHYEWDDVPGFGVRIYPSGHKTFVLKYRNQYGKQRYHKIGVFPEFSASAARLEAERIRAIVREGGDPKEEAARLKSTFSVEELGDEWLAKYAKARRKTWETDESRLRRHIFSRWKTLAAPEVTKPMVAKLHQEIAAGAKMKTSGGKVEANRTLQLLFGVYDWAIRNQLLPAGTDNPAAGISKFEEKSRRRWVEHHEMPWLLRSIEKHDADFSREVFWFILHTGARKGEALELRWRDVDLEGMKVTFRDTKNGSDHTVPLSKPLANRLESIPRVSGNPFVFPGYVDGQPLTDVRRAWNTIKDRAGELAKAADPKPVEIDITDVTIHDLRRTVGAWLATAGYSELLIGRVLNHTTQSVTGIYARLGDGAVRRALDDLAEQLDLKQFGEKN